MGFASTEMKIHIHRGQNQIGGSIIEISSETTRLLFDIGINLDETENVQIPRIDGVFVGQKKCDGVFISHYHPDHLGLVSHLLNGIPVYMGEAAFRIYKSAEEYQNRATEFQPVFIKDGIKITVGDLKVTPYLCDHSAFDSYMFVIENDGKKILYTGDFRANGRADFSKLLSRLPKADAVITEGTTLSREYTGRNIEEEQLEDIAVEYLKKFDGPVFIMMSSMNIDRLMTACHIARRTGRIFLEDLYTAGIASEAGEGVPVPDRSKNVRVFMTGGDRQHEALQQYGDAKIGKEAISKQPFLMIIRQSMASYLDKLNELVSFKNGVLFYGMWKGYLEQPGTKKFVEHLEERGLKFHVLHTSGHADRATIEELIDHTQPRMILPVHTDNAKWFERYCENCRVICGNNETVV